MASVIVNTDTTIVPPILFGCAFRNLSIQLGFNNNPTTFSVGVVRDVDQTFSLKPLADQGIYSMQNIQLGSIDEWAVVESWEESEVDIAGSGVFAVKLIDARSVLEGINIITGSLNIDAFTSTRPNILSIKEMTLDGIKDALIDKIFNLRGENFKINIDEFFNIDFVGNTTEPIVAEGGGTGLGTALPTVTCPSATPTRSDFKKISEGGPTVPISTTKSTETGLDTQKLIRSIEMLKKLFVGKTSNEQAILQIKLNSTEARLRSKLRQQGINPDKFFADMFKSESASLPTTTRANDNETFAQKVDRLGLNPTAFSDVTGLFVADGGDDVSNEDDNAFRGVSGGITQQPIQITLTLKDVINQLVEEAGAVDWFVSTSKNNNIFTITIKLIQRSLATDIQTDIDIIAQQHVNKIIKKKTGTENNPNSGQTKVLFGGLKQKLIEFPSDRIKPFWGFDDLGIPFVEPTIKITDQTIETTEDILSQSITNEFALLTNPNRTIPFTREDMNLIKNYADEFWGRQFYIEIDGSDIDVDGVTFLNAVRKSWFESDQTPDNVGIDLQDKFRFLDGRWPTIVKTPQKSIWSDITLRNNGVLLVDGLLYVGADIRIQNDFFIIRLKTPLTFKDIESGLFQKKRLSTLQKAWLSIEDTRERYGPWTNDENADIEFDGSNQIEIDDNLIPWRMRLKNLNNTGALNALDKFALDRLGFAQPQSRTLQTITLEVADLPKFNIGQLFQGGSAINSMSIQFSTSRITTIYTVKTFTLNLQQKIVNTVGSNSSRAQEGRLEKECDDEEKKRNEEERQLDDPPGVLPDVPEEFDEQEEIFENELTPPETNWLYRLGQQKGGVGVIIGARGGARYDINRLDSEFDFGAIGEWTNVPNLAENEDGESFLPNGTRVEVTLYDTGELTPSTPLIALIGEEGGGKGIDAIQGGDINTIGSTRKKVVFNKTPGSFQATIIGGGGDGIYNVTREADTQGFSAQNTAEKDGSPGYVPVGTRVDLGVDDAGVVFFNQTPTVFAIPEST